MNNSLARLIEGMVATLRSEVIPHVDTEFARGQAYGVIYLLNSIRLRAEWSAGFFREQLAAQLELREALAPLHKELDGPDLPDTAPTGADSKTLELLRDANDERICELIVWRSDKAALIGTERANVIEAALQRYMNRQLKWELQTSAKPMFAEMSSGSE
ncbi:MAG: hypothetical protein ACT4QA_21635 [Panacagrimonas sp.]